MEIKLTEQEDELCALLDECTRSMKEGEGIETSCRIAGGWVRDKVLSCLVRILNEFSWIFSTVSHSY